MRKIGIDGLLTRRLKNEPIEFYGHEIALSYDRDSITLYVRVGEDGQILNMPLLPGDTVGLWNPKRGHFEDWEFSPIPGYRPFGVEL